MIPFLVLRVADMKSLFLDTFLHRYPYSFVFKKREITGFMAAAMAVFLLSSPAFAQPKTLTILQDESGTPKAVWGEPSQDISSPPSEIINTYQDNSPKPSPIAAEQDRCIQAGTPTPLTLQTNDLLSTSVADWAQKNGYDLSWQANQYRSNGHVVLDKEFDRVLTDFKNMLDLNGIHLDITIYKNCTVRVTEVQS